MLFAKSSLVILATSGVALGRSVRRHATLDKRQGYIPDCTYTIEAISGDTCEVLAEFATITVEQFKAYNPQVSDCNALIIGNEYCLEKNFGQPDPVTSSSSSSSSKISSTTAPVQPSSKSSSLVTSTVTPTPTKPAGTPAPAPTQEGVAANCNRWDVIKSGDNCGVYTTKYPGLTLADLVKFNPAIGAQCTNLWVEYALCTSVEGWSPAVTTAVTTSTKPTSTSNAGVPAPAPTQAGVAANCNRWDVIKSGDSCGVYTAKYPGLTLADLVKFNPAIGAQCTNLWVEYALCTSVEGWKPATTVTTSTKPTSTSIAGAVPAPGPTQAGAAANCNRWDIVKSGNTCDTFTKKYSGVTLANLVSWNPAIGTQCTSLWLDYYICTGVVGFTAPATTTTPTQPAPTSSLPSPVQDGINAKCKKFHKVVSGDGCYDLAATYKITLNNFYSWNPSVKNDCSSLWSGYYVCVGV